MTERTIDTLMPSAIIPMMNDLSTLISLTGNRFKRASDDERALALVYLEDWLKGRRD